ncbi:MAG: DNA-protecting protein DprA, partial [Rikenellaceae bacterium]|nr:DNA-protecting protein DprA [Rikenellaceae bacterium]
MTRDDIALSLLRLPPAVTVRLWDHYASASELLTASRDDLMTRAGLPAALADRIASCATYSAADSEMEFVRRWGITTLSYNADDYPPLLRQTPDAPSLLYVKGDFDFTDRRHLYAGVVGTRRMTPAGEAVVRRVIEELAAISKEVVIVSGLAYGIDGVAHRAALEHGLATVAVVAHGLDTLYPAQHRDLARRIIERGGALVTEYPSGTSPLPPYFLARNRIVAG